jgi:hypothetical protein
MAVVPSRSWPVVPCDLSTSRRESAGVCWRLLVHGPLTGGFRTAVATREEGLLTAASDERFEKPILGGWLRVRFAPCF